MTLKELRSLPFRNWNETKLYKSIIVIPSGKKHESGWALMYIIGVNEEQIPFEIAAYCDDICWKMPTPIEYEFRNDMFYPSGAMHFWSRKYYFEVGSSLSSTGISLIQKK